MKKNKSKIVEKLISKTNEVKKVLIDPIKTYFSNKEENKQLSLSKEIFLADDNVDIKTDLLIEEVKLIATIDYNENFLIEKGIGSVYGFYLNTYMRKKISLDRKSRGEFVNMNTNKTNAEETLNTLSSISNIQGAKK